MKTKHSNDAVVGNRNVTASFAKTGELLRFYYPANRQYIDEFLTGVKINDSGLIYCHRDINNLYQQYYTKNTNILNTEIYNTYFNLRIIQTDFVSIKENVLIKKYTFKNEGNIDLDTKFLVHSKLLSDSNNDVAGRVSKDALIQYAHDYAFCTFSKQPLYRYQINNNAENIGTGMIGGKDYEGMSVDSSICYDLGILKPGEKKILSIFIYINHNQERYNISQIDEEIERIKKIEVDKEEASVKAHWQKYVNAHKGITLKTSKNEYEEKIEEIYKRTILLYPLLMDSQTGGISATIEIDEEKKHCGRYAFCWTRDAVFITKAMDILKMEKDTEKFYKNFCKNTQSKSGFWEQRFYTDGTLAPCWGYQIDETASVVYGIYEHYLRTKDKKFLKDTLKMCEKAVKALKKYIEDILNNTHKLPVSYDLWEMQEGIHLYSLASIFSAFECMAKIYDELKENYENNRLRQEDIAGEKEQLEHYRREIKKYMLDNLYDNEKRTFVRNTEDKRMDVSMMGAVVPFQVFSPKEKKVLNTVERIDLTLRTYTSGYKRFEYDHYMGGTMPWPITTLWMALYFIQTQEYEKALQCFYFVVNSATEHGFLAEQVNNETMESSWIIGLGWSHAMFIIVLEKLNQLGLV